MYFTYSIHLISDILCILPYSTVNSIFKISQYSNLNCWPIFPFLCDHIQVVQFLFSVSPAVCYPEDSLHWGSLDYRLNKRWNRCEQIWQSMRGASKKVATTAGLPKLSLASLRWGTWLATTTKTGTTNLDMMMKLVVLAAIVSLAAAQGGGAMSQAAGFMDTNNNGVIEQVICVQSALNMSKNYFDRSKK